MNSSSLTPQVWTVQNKRQETDDVWTLTLSRKGGKCEFLPGQFNMIGAFGSGEVAISVSQAGTTAGQVIHTIRRVGRSTSALVELKKGDQVALRGPFGRGWPLTQVRGQDLIFVAGGLGLAPLRPAIHRVLQQREHYGRLVLIYGARSPDQLLFLSEVKRWSQRQGFKVELTVDHATRGWRGHVGVVTSLFETLKFEPHQTHSLICGPEIMMRFVALELESKGLGRERMWLSMERNMKCAVGICGHCQYGSSFVCQDGPVYSFDQIDQWLTRKGV